MTDTHVPPKKAFNEGEARRSMYDVEGNMVMSRPRPGGIRSWGLCEGPGVRTRSAEPSG